MQAVTYRRLLKGFMWAAVAVGAYARLWGLGAWPWALDEFYTVRSVANIVQFGVPAFPCGGYYMRELTVQYLVAPFFALGADPEFAARLVAVAFSFVALAAVYALGKRLSGVTVACASVVLLSVSLWEIEFARFARMYMPFQALFLCYVLALHQVVVDGKRRAYGWLWALSVLGVLTWAGGLFLLVVNFIPVAMARAPGRARHLAVSLGLLVLGYMYSALNFRFMGSTPPLPTDVPVRIGGSQIVLPPLLAQTLAAYPAWIPGAVLIALISLLAAVLVARDAVATVRERATWIVLIALSAVNLFGCVLIGLALALWLEWVDARRSPRRGLIVAAPAIAVNFVYWLCYAFFTEAPRQLFPGFGPGGELSKLLVVLFKYPNIFDPVVFQWLDVTPTLTIVLGGLLALAGAWALWHQHDNRVTSLRITLATTLIMTALIGVADTKYHYTRYSFFLLPVLYLVGAATTYALIRRLVRARLARCLALGAAISVLMVTSQDFGWAHMVHMSRADWNYRLHYDLAQAMHYYVRWDYRSPAQFVNRRLKPADRVVITTLPVAYYLKRTNYVYRNYDDIEFAAVACDRGRRERWSNARLLYRKQALSQMIEKTRGTVWMIVNMRWRPVPKRLFEKPFSAKLVYRGHAHNIGVYKIDASRPAPPPFRPLDPAYVTRSRPGSPNSYRRVAAIRRLIGAGP